MLKTTMLTSLFFFVLLYDFAHAQIPAPLRRQRGTTAIPGDRWIATWKNGVSRTRWGTLEVRDILTRNNGDPLNPTRKGAVLTELNAVSYVFLRAGAATTSARLENEQCVLYITGGEGSVTAGGKTAGLAEGVGVLMPPGIEFTLSAQAGGEPLTGYMVFEPVPAGFTPRRTMVVKNAYDLPVSTNLNRGSSDIWLFGPADGLATLVAATPVMYEPRSLVSPHIHGDGEEEVWIALSGDLEIVIGDEQLALPAGSALRPPADSLTPHANINSGETSKRTLWLMTVPLSPEERQSPNRTTL